MLADEDIVDIVGHDNNTSITFQLPDNRHYNSVILHINISIEIYTISFGAISKLKGTCCPKKIPCKFHQKFPWTLYKEVQYHFCHQNNVEATI